MNILYKITYLPHLKNQTPPYYYVGSKYNYGKKYFGSPSSKQKDWYSGDLTICKWWKEKIKNNIDNPNANPVAKPITNCLVRCFCRLLFS